jgi:F0F1-type ATP synthase membrane subunit c/vacuolar-type H+-ATPase subunit K
MIIVVIGIPMYLLIGNTARILLGSAVGREASFGQQLAALKDWRLAAEQSEVGVSFFGRMFFTAGNGIVAYTPSQYPYRYPSPVKYAKEFAIYMLPDQMIRRVMGITDRTTKVSVLLKTDYTGTWLLRDFGIEVSPTTSVEVSTIGHFWMLGGFLPVLFGGFAVALVHGLVARITRRFWIRNPDKAIFYFASLCYCFIWSMNWDLIQLLRNVLWNSIYALVAWMFISHFLKIGGGATSEQYEQPELIEDAK